jgi:hypothetical protein
MAPSNKSTWILEKKESSFEEFNDLAGELFPKKEGDNKLLLHHNFSFAVLSRYIRSVPTKKTDGTVARKFVVWFRMYLQTKQNTTGANTSTDRRLPLAEIESTLGIFDLTEWVPPFAFRTLDPDPYAIVHGVCGGGDKTFCVGTLRTKGQNRNAPKKNEVIDIDQEDLPLGADVASYDGQTQPYKKANSPFSSPRKKPVKMEKPQSASSDILDELSPIYTKSKRTAAQIATKQIVKQKKKERKLEQVEEGSLIASDSTSSNEPRIRSREPGVVAFKSGNEKHSSSIDSSDTSTSSSSDSSVSDSSKEDRKKKKKRKRSKDKRRRKREKRRKSSKKQQIVDISSEPGSDYKDTHKATMTTKSNEDKDISPKKEDTVFSRTCCNKDCKITEKYTPVDYGCNTCRGRCHWDCLHDAHTCISCSTAADPTGNEPAESAVALVEPPSATPVKTGVGEEKKAVNPLDDQGGPNIYGNLAYASVEELQMALARRIQLKQQKETTDTVMVAPTQGGENEE